MAEAKLSSKRLQIDKANVVVVVATAAAVAIVIFSLFAVKALLSQQSYQSRVIAKKEVAKKQLQSNLGIVNNLVNSYKQFVNPAENIIGGISSGTGERDGDNAKIILDALPSQYDFPALVTSLERLAIGQGGTIQSITGSDEEVSQEQSTSVNPQPVDMPFEMTVDNSYRGAKNIINVMELSIRPFNFNELIVSAGDSGKVSLDIKAKTYYQPAKSLNIRSEVIK